MPELIYSLNSEEIEKFCNTIYMEDGEENILGFCPSYGRRSIMRGMISKIEIYAHDEFTKSCLTNAKVSTSLFALAYDKESDVHWYYPCEAISNISYIPVLEEYGHWGWMILSPHVFEHVLGKGDKLTSRYGGKGVISQILDEDNSNSRRPLPRRDK